MAQSAAAPDAAALIKNVAADPDAIPEGYWSVLADPQDSAMVGMRGAVLVRVKKVAPNRDSSQLPEELRAALEEPPARALAEVWRTMKEDGILTPLVIAAALLLSATAVAFEALLYRGLLDLARNLSISGQRYVALAAVLTLLGLMLALGVADRIFSSAPRTPLGESFPLTLPRETAPPRGPLLSKPSRVGHGAARAFSSTLAPIANARRAIAQDGVHSGGHPGRHLVVLSIELSVGRALCRNRSRDSADRPTPLSRTRLRQREHTGALTRFYLDALLGLGVIRAHGGQRAMRREQEKLLAQWAEAGMRLQRAVVQTEALQLTLATSLVVVLIWQRLAIGADVAGLLLLVYWALNIPALGQELANALWQYPALRNTTLRLIEPLGSPEQQRSIVNPHSRNHYRGVAIAIENVTVVAGGHLILDDISLRDHALASTSALSDSQARANPVSLDYCSAGSSPRKDPSRSTASRSTSERTDRLRMETAWLDPQVHLWNRPLVGNLLFGNEGRHEDFEPVLDSAGLRDVLGAPA